MVLRCLSPAQLCSNRRNSLTASIPKMQLSGTRSAAQQRLSSTSSRTMLICSHPSTAAMARSACVPRAAAASFSGSSSSTSQALRTRAAVPAVRAQRRSVAALAVRAEISYVMVKPDGVQRGLVGEIISRFERKGFKLVGLKLYQTPKEVAEEHYKDLSSRPFYNDLVKYIVSGPVVAMVWEGDGVVASARKMIGATNPLQSEPGTIRGDFAIQTGRNIVHGSDSPDNGVREAALWFPEGTLTWDQTLTPWLKE